MPAGRPAEFTDEIQQQAWEYLETYSSEHDHKIPSVVGLCIIINRSRSTVYDWADRDDNQFSDILDAINEKQHFVLINKGLSGEFNSNITKLVLGKHGFHEKTDTQLTGANGGPVQVQEIQFVPVDSDD